MQESVEPVPEGRCSPRCWLWECGATALTSAADGVETLMVPSAAMGRDIPVAFLAGGPHAVVLLDAYNAGDSVSNWVTAGNAMNTLAGRASPWWPWPGGVHPYTNWEADGTRQWETFLSDELPNWLAANKGLAPGGRDRRRRPGRYRRRWRPPSTRTATATPVRCRRS